MRGDRHRWIRCADRAGGGFPSGVAVHPSGTFAYISDAPEGGVTVIDTVGNRVMTSFLLADDGVGNAAAVALTGDGSTALVPDFLFSNVYTIDTGRHAVTNFFPLGDISAGPERLALVELPGRCPTPPIPRLTADLSAAATEMHVDRIDAFPVVGTARVADEIVTYRSTFMGVVRELSRGVLDTTPAAHASGTLVHVIRPGDADCDTRRGAADLSTIVLKIIAAVLPGPCGEDANGDRVVSEADLVTAEHALFD